MHQIASNGHAHVLFSYRLYPADTNLSSEEKIKKRIYKNERKRMIKIT